MKLYDFLQFSVCVFSILAAGFWLQSAATTLPKLTKNLSWDGYCSRASSTSGMRPSNG